MKKILLIMALMLFAGVVMAADTSGVNFKTMTFNNTTGAYKTTYVSSSVFPTRFKVLGFEIMWKQAGSENIAALHDTTETLGLTSDSLFGEAETLPNSFNGLWYPYPKRLEHGLCVVQGGYSLVYVYYVEY